MQPLLSVLLLFNFIFVFTPKYTAIDSNVSQGPPIWEHHIFTHDEKNLLPGA